MSRVYNFSAGPATLPLEVLEQVQSELLDWQHLGLSILEIGHRTQEFTQLAEKIQFDLRSLLSIPSHYKVLFLQGGARSQFAMVPMNLLRGKSRADYLTTGIWSELALKEAKRYGDVNEVASSVDTQYRTISDSKTWKISDDSAYFHYVDNETINGVEFPEIPNLQHMPVVSDMSSNLLSRPIDVNRFGLIYAGAQKNIAIAGLTLVIVREDLLDIVLPQTPSMFTYKIHADNNSMYNTPPIFAWYVAGLVIEWVKKQGGLARMQEQSEHKASKLYQFIDQNDFYFNAVEKKYRSRMNVVFNLKEEKHNDLFLQESKQAGLAFLKGHKLVGGMRASLYNAMPEKGVDALIDFMANFAKRYG